MKKPLYNRIDRFWIKHYYDNMNLYSSKPLFIAFYERDKYLSKLGKELNKSFEPIINFLNKYL